jgi:hypothetical protein
MSRIFVLIIIVISATINILPQESSFYDAPLGGGIGYTPGWIMPKVDGINAQLKNIDFPGLPSGGFYSSGVSGFIYLGALKNFRIGGFGFGGSRSNAGYYDNPVVNQNTTILGREQREAVYSLNGGGISIEYTLPYIRDIAVSIGTLLGRGSQTIELNRNFGSESWDRIWSEIYGYNISSLKLKNNYWLVTPTINVEIPAYHMLCFRIGAGYQFTFGGSWTYNNAKDISNVPSNINGNGFFIQTGIFIGLFSF